jgi:hypothetical protein
MRAEQLEVSCEAVVHRGLLTSEVTFTVTGTDIQLDEFHKGVEAFGAAVYRKPSR